MRCHVTCHVAMQVVRSLPIRSRCLAMRTGKAYDTSTAARSDQRQRQLVHRFELPAKAKNASKSLFFRCAQPEAEGSLEYSFVDREPEFMRSVENLLATWLGAHTMARRLCEAARRRQARVTASARLGRYFDDRTRRRVGPKPAGIPLACASAQSPSRRREGP